MFILGTKNTASQSLLTGGIISLGSLYQNFSKKNYLGIKPFEFNGNSISLQQIGIYHITATITFTAPAAGTVIFQLSENGEAIPGALATETITTATTEIKTTTIDYYLLVDGGCVLGNPTTLAKSITLVNSGVDATVTNVVVNVEKNV